MKKELFEVNLSKEQYKFIAKYFHKTEIKLWLVAGDKLTDDETRNQVDAVYMVKEAGVYKLFLCKEVYDVDNLDDLFDDMGGWSVEELAKDGDYVASFDILECGIEGRATVFVLGSGKDLEKLLKGLKL